MIIEKDFESVLKNLKEDYVHMFASNSIKKHNAKNEWYMKTYMCEVFL